MVLCYKGQDSSLYFVLLEEGLCPIFEISDNVLFIKFCG